ncbi:MAG TPA: lasso peptide biosynthesis B2 protein [Gemmatimonadaceae bacterium]|nr:lasso peptide biosynthesis B2 protein [Gemmatimonadaceae bacterium]
MPLRSRLARWQRVRPWMLAELATGQWALLRAQLRLWLRPTGALVRESRGPEAARGDADEARLAAAVARASRAVHRAARYGLFQPSCLVRSLALAELLARQGVPGPLIRVGVRRTAGVLDAHAWIELDGRVIGDDPRRTRAFTPLGTLTVRDRR